MGWTICCSNPGRGENFLKIVHTDSGANPAFYSFPGVKQPGYDVDHSPIYSGKVKNGWSYASAPPVCLYGLYMDSCM